MEDDLCLEFARASQLTLHNPTNYNLYLGIGGGVFANERILSGACIGEVEGTPEFLHDMTHYDYIQLDSDYALDVTTVVSRSILTWIRGEYFIDAHPNCEVRMEVDESTHTSRFYVWTTQRIDINEELVYRIPTT